MINGQTTSITPATIAAISGALLEAASVLVFMRASAANERMDRYHKELFRVRQLNILLSASDQLDSTINLQSKNDIINTTMKYWFSSNAETEPPPNHKQ